MSVIEDPSRPQLPPSRDVHFDDFQDEKLLTHSHAY